MTVTIRREDYEKILEYARSCLPEEACGLIAGRKTGAERIIEKVYFLTNIDHSNEHFSLDPREQLAAIKDMRANKLVPLGNWHSHPETPSRPSEEDKRLAFDSRASYLILSLANQEQPVLNSFHIEGKKVEKEQLIIMEKHTFGSEYGFATRAIHTGNDIDSESGAIKRPITMANSYALPYDPTDMNWSSAEGNLYTRNGGTNQKYLQERIASLEGGEDCVVLASGVAALSGLFFALLKQGDHVIFSSVTYIAVYRLLNELLNEKFGVETTIIDTSDPENVVKALRPNTKLIHIETPGNPTLTISDIKAIADIAHAHGALLSVDNTFASPYNQRPIELGADFSVESLTKYINGHGDAMGGAITGKKEYLDIIRAQSQVNLGGVISPFNAWLIMRGSVTLPLRMRQHNENALTVARYLESLDCVSFVAYPGLESNRGHKVAEKQMQNGYGGVLSFGLKADHDTHNQFVSHLNVITSAVSLGHDESLIVFLGENDERQYLYPEEFHNGFFRFSVGIEDVDDIIGDIQQALQKIGLL